MDQDALVIEQIDEGTKFLNEFGKKYPVRIAMWMKPSEDAQWYLHVVSDQIDDKNIDDAYREVLRLNRPFSSPYFDAFRIKLIGADDSTAMAALDIHRRYSARISTRVGRSNFGGMPVEGVYIYPPPAAAHAS